MRIQVINVAQKMPAWVDNACREYDQRLPREMPLQFVNLPLAKRHARQSATELKQRESKLILEKLEQGSFNLALDEQGELWTSRDWSRHLQRWMSEYPRVNLIIGGPDGLSSQCLDVCHKRVSFGRMTLPHALVRVVLIEQLYRAWTILQGHPYHRD